MSLVLVRTPTYRRPELLKRAMRCLQAQTHQEWICEVRDDCPDHSARAVVEELGDPRIRYTPNNPRKFMVRNLDDCYLRENPHGADYFYMLEDDNQVLPDFMKRGIEILEQTGVSICQLNQLIEFKDGPGGAHVGENGIFDGMYDERVYQPEEFQLAIFGATGISNGAVIWSRKIQHELAIRVTTIPTLEEYLRTALVAEPIYISREKLAIWAKNEEATNRNIGLGKNWLRRELDLKASITALQRGIWERTPANLRRAFLDGGVLRIHRSSRYEAMRKAGIREAIASSENTLKDAVKRQVVRRVGRVHPSVADCLRRSSSSIPAR